VIDFTDDAVQQMVEQDPGAALIESVLQPTTPFLV
jgi:hypothetical protein